MAGNSPTFGNQPLGLRAESEGCVVLSPGLSGGCFLPLSRSAGEIPSSEAAQRRKELPYLLPAAGWSRSTVAKYVFFLDAWQSAPTLSYLQNSRSLFLPPLKPPPISPCLHFPPGAYDSWLCSLPLLGRIPRAVSSLSQRCPRPCALRGSVGSHTEAAGVFRSSQEL